MNVKDMDTYFDGDIWHRVLHVKYKNGPITEALVEDNPSKLTFFFCDGRVLSHNIAKKFDLNSAFISQFGISVSEDAALFFIQSWGKGLFCFDMQTGDLRWHYKLKRAYNLVVLPDVVICRFMENCVMSLDILTGEMRNRIPLGYSTKFVPINDNRYLIGPKHGKYYIIDENLSNITTLRSEDLNPNNYETFLLLEANAVPEGIEIHGFERPYGAKGSEKDDRFSRTVSCIL